MKVLIKSLHALRNDPCVSISRALSPLFPFIAFHSGIRGARQDFSLYLEKEIELTRDIDIQDISSVGRAKEFQIRNICSWHVEEITEE